MKIPTLLGLILLLIAIGLGTFLYTYKLKMDNSRKVTFTPTDIEIVNISDNQAAIIWQTKTALIGSINWGNTSNLTSSQIDDQDTNSNQTPRLIHFVTIKNLEPATNYFFKIQSDKFKFPDQPSQFKTAPKLASQVKSNAPLIGSVLDTDLQLVTEGLVFLNLGQASNLATFITTKGNYLLPLTDLRDITETKQFVLSKETDAALVVKSGSLKSNVKITLPPGKEPLEPIILGQDSDFTALATDNPITFDLNGDGQINAVDLSIILSNFNKDQQNESADLNQDGFVDEQDLDMMKSLLGENSKSQ